MTSGQEPPQEGSGWAPAPPPPPSGYPPAPGSPPPGYGYGYGPAPSAPQGYGAPPALERPTAVRAGLGAFIAGLALAAIGLIYEAFNFSSILDAARAQLSEQQSQAVSQLGPDAERAIIVISLVVGAVILLIEAMFVWFAWNGRNWARIVLWILAGLTAVFGVANLGSTGYLPGFVHGLSICQWLLSLAAIVLLALKPANEWYRYRKWLRATGQRG